MSLASPAADTDTDTNETNNNKSNTTKISQNQLINDINNEYIYIYICMCVSKQTHDLFVSQAAAAADAAE